MTSNKLVTQWVDEVAKITQPDKIYWCDGSDAEYDRMVKEMVDRKEFIPLNKKNWPGCYLYRSDPSDVARTEKVTYICSEKA